MNLISAYSRQTGLRIDKIESPEAAKMIAGMSSAKIAPSTFNASIKEKKSFFATVQSTVFSS